MKRSAREPVPACKPGDHMPTDRLLPPEAIERAARILRAMGDPSRLRILELLHRRELCVTEIVEAVGQKFTTVSQQLRLLHAERLVHRRREGNHIHYALSDRHVVDLILNALAHARELDGEN